MKVFSSFLLSTLFMLQFGIAPIVPAQAQEGGDDLSVCEDPPSLKICRDRVCATLLKVLTEECYIANDYASYLVFSQNELEKLKKKKKFRKGKRKRLLNRTISSVQAAIQAIPADFLPLPQSQVRCDLGPIECPEYKPDSTPEEEAIQFAKCTKYLIEELQPDELILRIQSYAIQDSMEKLSKLINRLIKRSGRKFADKDGLPKLKSEMFLVDNFFVLAVKPPPCLDH